MADDSEQVDQNEIERLLNQAKGGGAEGANEPAASDEADAPASGADDTTVDQSEIEALLNKQGGGASGDASPPKAEQPAADASAAAAADDDGGETLRQEDIESLLSQSGVQPAAAKPAASGAAAESGDDQTALPPGDVEFLLDQAQSALASLEKDSADDLPPGVEVFQLEEFGRTPPSTEVATLELVRDVELDLAIELGRTHMYLEDVLKLRKGSVVALDKLAGDPVDIYVNGRLVARGEVLVLNDNFCVRVAELLAGDRAKAS